MQVGFFDVCSEELPVESKVLVVDPWFPKEYAASITALPAKFDQEAL